VSQNQGKSVQLARSVKWISQHRCRRVMSHAFEHGGAKTSAVGTHIRNQYSRLRYCISVAFNRPHRTCQWLQHYILSLRAASGRGERCATRQYAAPQVVVFTSTLPHEILAYYRHNFGCSDVSHSRHILRSKCSQAGGSITERCEQDMPNSSI
jgi:hypothetical protein